MPFDRLENVDDKNFDQATALEWIKIIEDPSASIREKDIYPLLKSWLLQSSANNVLDIGCGQGACSIHLGESQIRYVGLDPSQELIRRAKELYSDPTRSFKVGNAYNLPFENKHFGTAFSVAVWHLLGDISKASSELSRVLKDDGKFLIVTADPAQYQTWMERYESQKIDVSIFIGTNRNSDGSSTTDTLYLYTAEEIIGSLKAQGLQISTIQTIRSFVAISGYKV